MRTRREGRYLLIQGIDPPITRDDVSAATAIPLRRLCDIMHVTDDGRSAKIDLRSVGLAELLAMTSYLTLPWVPVAIDWFRVNMKARSTYAVGVILGRAASYIRKQLGITLEGTDEENTVQSEETVEANQ